MEKEGYKAMMYTFIKSPSPQIPVAKTMSKLATSKLRSRQGTDSSKEMSAGEDVRITRDGWTSGNGLAMMGVTGHCANNERKHGRGGMRRQAFPPS